MRASSSGAVGSPVSVSPCLLPAAPIYRNKLEEVVARFVVWIAKIDRFVVNLLMSKKDSNDKTNIRENKTAETNKVSVSKERSARRVCDGHTANSVSNISQIPSNRSGLHSNATTLGRRI
jgi:mannitol-specific phosphotransferase system IIBC component